MASSWFARADRQATLGLRANKFAKCANAPMGSRRKSPRAAARRRLHGREQVRARVVPVRLFAALSFLSFVVVSALGPERERERNTLLARNTNTISGFHEARRGKQCANLPTRARAREKQSKSQVRPARRRTTGVRCVFVCLFQIVRHQCFRCCFYRESFEKLSWRRTKN